MRGGGQGHAPDGGFNLLPWRLREMRRLRRRRVLEWGAAVLVGCACAAPLAGWQRWERGRVDARREAGAQAVAQLRVPLAEAQRLTSAAARQRTAEHLAQLHAKPLIRLLTLFDALAQAGIPGVMLQQLAQHGGETELQATAVDETAASAWLGRLRALPDVEAVSVREMKRASAAGGPKPRATGSEPIRVMAHVVWRGEPGAPERVGKRLANEMRNAK